MREALKRLPPRLPDTYTRILDRLDSNYRSKAIKALFWLAYSKRYITVKELAETMAVDAGKAPRFDPEERLFDDDEIFRICSSLIAISTVYSEDYVSLAHFTVKEYLMTIHSFEEPTTVDSHGNMVIAEDCISYLTAIINNTYESPKHPDGLGSSRLSTDFPLCRYASRLWTYHTQAAGEHHERLFSIMVDLFQRHTLEACLQVSKHVSLSLDSKYAGLSNPIPLVQAAERGFIRLAEHLLHEGADINSIQNDGFSSFGAAAANGHTNVVKMLLDAGANADGGSALVKQSEPLYDHRTGSLLNRVVVDGHLEIARILLDKAVAVNQGLGSAIHRYPLTSACLCGHIPLVKLLLSKGALINAGSDENLPTALYAACESYRVKSNDTVKTLLDLLLSHGADLEAGKDCWGTPLATASHNGNLTVMKYLMDAGADINAQDDYIGSVLHTACQSRRKKKTASLLLDAGADPTIYAKAGTTLQAACSGRPFSSSLVRRLVDSGVDVNGSGSRWCRALQGAALRGQIPSVRLLLER